MNCTSDNMPPLVRREGDITRLFFGFVEVEKEVNEVVTKSYEGINVNMKGPVTYDSVVSAIVVDRYSTDQRDAIMLNRELVRDDAEIANADRYIADYTAFQDWRIYAKSIAVQVLAALAL